ncbi:MAG: hypothetical protein JW751_21020, partial [Polyangiaceae bacterium]|nr:hypothetical protein [Polyangiaceae bacterium]
MCGCSHTCSNVTVNPLTDSHQNKDTWVRIASCAKTQTSRIKLAHDSGFLAVGAEESLRPGSRPGSTTADCHAG